MPDLFIFDKTYDLLGKSLDVSARRHGLISSNISNVDNIAYTPKDLDFQKTLKQELRKSQKGLSVTKPKHIRQTADARLPAAIRKNEDGTDAESVDIDTEMVNLMENNLKYRSSVEMMLRKISMLRHAITEGGR